MKIGLISDIHANAVSLRAVLEDLKGKADKVICAGDIVGYNPYPDETIRILKEYGIECVMGNYDRAVITGDTQWFNHVANQTIKWTRDHISQESMNYLLSLPEKIEFNGLTVYHGSPGSLKEMVYESTPHERFCKIFDGIEVKVVVFGHTHVPVHTVCGDKVIINPGSVGQPRDGDPRASYAIWDTETNEFTLHRVEYDYKAVQKKIEEAGLPKFMADRLAFGK